MNQKEMINKNLDLHFHLIMQLLRDPDSIDLLDEAETILLPRDDAELREANLPLGTRREKLGKRVVYIETKLVPETRTVMIPKLTLLRSA